MIGLCVDWFVGGSCDEQELVGSVAAVCWLECCVAVAQLGLAGWVGLGGVEYGSAGRGGGTDWAMATWPPSGGV